jgi:hypothetical protein
MGSLQLLGLSLLGAGVIATSAIAGEDQTTRIGCVSAVGGAVAFHARSGDWSPAELNIPIATGVALRTGSTGRAALAVAGNRVALAPAGELRVTEFGPALLQIVLTQGRIGVHIGPADAERTVEIDLAQGGVWLNSPGDYDIAAGGEHAPARVAVFAGTAKFAATGIHSDIAAGSLALVEGGDAVTVTTTAAAVPDGFTDWWRPTEAADNQPATHVSPTIAGAEMLDTSGRWETTADYGEIWYPNGVADDWAPFRYGKWKWIEPGGWTWIDDAAWGFAPSHYGSWVQIDKRWAWVPGPQTDEPVYSAARIAFLGTPGIGLSYAGGTGPAVGWFPLAPGEQIDETSVDDFRNRRSASVVPRSVFAGSRPVAPALLGLPEQRLDDAPIIFGALGIAPPVAKPPESRLAAVAGVVKSLPTRVANVVRLLASRRQMLHGRVQLALASVPHRPAIMPRARVVASTLPVKPAHNRQHLAAARGGAQ